MHYLENPPSLLIYTLDCFFYKSHLDFDVNPAGDCLDARNVNTSSTTIQTIECCIIEVIAEHQGAMHPKSESLIDRCAFEQFTRQLDCTRI